MNIELKTFNARRACMYGHELTPVQRAILIASDPSVHTEVKFSSRYKGISFSATMAEGEDCARFKHIAYSNPAFWDTTIIPMSDEQEDMAFIEAERLEGWPYDTIGVTSLATKFDIIKPDPKKVWCSKACAKVICKAHPDFGAELVRLGYTSEYNIDPQDLMMLAEYWFHVMQKGI